MHFDAHVCVHFLLCHVTPLPVLMAALISTNKQEHLSKRFFFFLKNGFINEDGGFFFSNYGTNSIVRADNLFSSHRVPGQSEQSIKAG